MWTGSYVHFFLYSPIGCDGHTPTNSIEVMSGHNSELYSIELYSTTVSTSAINGENKADGWTVKVHSRPQILYVF